MNLPPRHVLDAAKARHHAAIANEQPGSITISGKSYSGALSISAQPITNEDGGQRMGDVLTFRLSKAAHPAQPAERTVITSSGKTWIIETVGGKEIWAAEWVIRAIQ